MNASKTLRRLAAFSFLLLSAGFLSAQVADRDAIANWPVPAVWSPTRPAGAIGTMTDISLAIPFVAVTPCRIADTQGSRDLEFSYLVQGVRASFKEMQPVIRDGTFVPESADAKIPPALAERQKQVLIENGTYKADGTVNAETARRLGWDRMWEKKRGGRGEPASEQPNEVRRVK